MVGLSISKRDLQIWTVKIIRFFCCKGFCEILTLLRRYWLWYQKGITTKALTQLFLQFIQGFEKESAINLRRWTGSWRHEDSGSLLLTFNMPNIFCSLSFCVILPEQILKPSSPRKSSVLGFKEFRYWVILAVKLAWSILPPHCFVWTLLLESLGIIGLRNYLPTANRCHLCGRSHDKYWPINRCFGITKPPSAHMFCSPVLPAIGPVELALIFTDLGRLWLGNYYIFKLLLDQNFIMAISGSLQYVYLLPFELDRVPGLPANHCCHLVLPKQCIWGYSFTRHLLGQIETDFILNGACWLYKGSYDQRYMLCQETFISIQFLPKKILY